jgi:hypothetical protein
MNNVGSTTLLHPVFIKLKWEFLGIYNCFNCMLNPINFVSIQHLGQLHSHLVALQLFPQSNAT